MNKLLPLILLLTACASTTPKVQYYLLDFEAVSEARAAPAVNLRVLTVPEYLGQRGIALRTNEQSVQHAQYHRWGEPLQAGIRRSVLQSIDDYEGELPQAALDFHINHFYGTPEGQVHLIAHWQAELPNCKVKGHLREQMPQAEAGYAALVQTQKQLLLKSMQATLRDLQSRIGECPDQSAQ